MPRTVSRRHFLGTSVAAAAAAAVPHAHAGGTDVLRVGLVGCGGRGSGAAGQALNADPNLKLVAMGDAFADRIEQSLATLKKDEAIAGKIDVSSDRRFVGFDAYKHVIAASDVVLLCTPPGFRPMHLKAAIDAGKHVFAEKPVAVDAPGVRSVLATCKQAEAKGLSIVSGLALRYDNGLRAAVARVHEGAIGDIHTLQANDYRGSIWVKPRQPVWTDMEYHMRNWYYFTWLSGDFNVEQHVHMLDTCSWAMGNQYPVKAIGTGGRQQRTGEEFGHIYDHFSITHEYANGARLFATCRQQSGVANDISARVVGTKGWAELTSRRGGAKMEASGTPWRYEGEQNNPFQTEHDVLFASIRSGKPVNNGEYMTKTTLLAIMGRMAAYTGQAITWEQALNSKEDLSPPSYDWNVPLPHPPVAVPGKTKFV